MAVRDKVGGSFCWLPASNETPGTELSQTVFFSQQKILL